MYKLKNIITKYLSPLVWYHFLIVAFLTLNLLLDFFFFFLVFAFCWRGGEFLSGVAPVH